MAQKKIKCIGFSVTSYGSPPYPVVLNQQLTDAGFETDVSYHATGGLSIDSLPYLLSSFVKKGEADLIIFEIATSWFSLRHTNLSSALKFVNALIAYCEKIGVRIIFLNLYRKNVDDHDVVVQAIEELCAHKYPVLDLKKTFRDGLDQSNNDETVDGVHPNQEAIYKIADQLCDYIIKYYSTLQLHATNEVEQVDLNLITPPELQQCNLFRFENRHGISLDAYKIQLNTTLNIRFDEKISLTGIFFLYGPDTNQINLAWGDNKINIPMQDKMSFYRRLGYKHFGVIETDILTIEHPLDQMNTELTKKSNHQSSECNNYIVGFTRLIC